MRERNEKRETLFSQALRNKASKKKKKKKKKKDEIDY